MILQQRSLVQYKILPYLDCFSLFSFARLCKNSMALLDPQSKDCVDYKIFYEEQWQKRNYVEFCDHKKDQAKQSLADALFFFEWTKEIKLSNR